MGRGKRQQPKRICEKVREIRIKLGFSQEKMFEALNSHSVNIYPGYVSLYEIGDRIPSLLVTLAYAREAGISSDLLIDDNLNLPVKLPR